MTAEVDEALLRSLTPGVLGLLVRRGADFAADEDAVQDALVEALLTCATGPARHPESWLVTVAWRRHFDATRAETARRRREDLVEQESRRTVAGVRFDRPCDVATVLRVLCLVFNEGYSGDVDLATGTVRLTRQLAAAIDHPDLAGPLALMLIHHARRRRDQDRNLARASARRGPVAAACRRPEAMS